MTNTSLNQPRTFQTSQSDADRHEISFDPDTESVSEILPLAVADLEDCDQVDLPRLADSIDPDALDSLIQPRSGEYPSQSNRTISYPYGKYEVRVHSEGLITLRVTEDTDTE